VAPPLNVLLAALNIIRERLPKLASVVMKAAPQPVYAHRLELHVRPSQAVGVVSMLGKLLLQRLKLVMEEVFKVASRELIQPQRAE